MKPKSKENNERFLLLSEDEFNCLFDLLSDYFIDEDYKKTLSYRLDCKNRLLARRGVADEYSAMMKEKHCLATIRQRMLQINIPKVPITQKFILDMNNLPNKKEQP